MSKKRILNVGQCGLDHGNISATLERLFDADVMAAEDTPDALSQLRQYSFDLVLVNRLMDLSGAPGMELIRKMQEDAILRNVPIMLVSNYEDAQQEAVAAGALPGFGKAALDTAPTAERIRKALG